MTLKEVLIFLLSFTLFCGAVVAGFDWYISRPLTCQMGKMKRCPYGRGIQFCQYDHYTDCFKMEVDGEPRQDTTKDP